MASSLLQFSEHGSQTLSTQEISLLQSFSALNAQRNTKPGVTPGSQKITERDKVKQFLAAGKGRPEKTDAGVNKGSVQKSGSIATLKALMGSGTAAASKFPSKMPIRPPTVVTPSKPTLSQGSRETGPINRANEEWYVPAQRPGAGISPRMSDNLASGETEYSVMPNQREDFDAQHGSEQSFSDHMWQ